LTLKVSTYADKETLCIYLIGDLIKKNKFKYKTEVYDMINHLKVKNLIINSEYLNNIDETGIIEIIKTYNLIYKNYPLYLKDNS